MGKTLKFILIHKTSKTEKLYSKFAKSLAQINFFYRIEIF
jgi:hypothetical protein